MNKRKVLKVFAVLLTASLTMQALPVTAYADGLENNVETVSENFVDEDVKAVAEQATDLDVSFNDLDEALDSIKDVPGYDVSSSDLETAKDDLQTLDKNLEVIDQKSSDVSDNLNDSVDAAVSANDIANEIENDVDTVNTEVESLIKKIEDATSVSEANTLFGELNKTVDTAEISLTEKKDAFEKLQEAFNAAIAKLESSEEALESELVKAKENADEIAEKISNINNQVQELADDIDDEISETPDDVTAISGLLNELAVNANSTKSMWEKARAKMYIIIRDYYIPNFVDANATDIKITYTKGFDMQDMNYNTVTYKDAKGKKHTFYINYDMSDKDATVSSQNRYNGLGNSGNIVIYEKPVQEIEANKYVKEYFAKANLSSNDKKAYAVDGKLDVFTYQNPSGKAFYMVREELEAEISKGKIKDNGDGTYTRKNGWTITQVILNQNSKVKNGTYLFDEENDEAYNNLVEASGLYDTLKNYDSQVEEAKAVVENVKEQADVLAETVDTLKSDKSNRNIISVLSDEELSKLTSAMTEEELGALETMSVKDAITFLKELVKKANQKVEDAVLAYEQVKEDRDTISKKIDELNASVNNNNNVSESNAPATATETNVTEEVPTVLTVEFTRPVATETNDEEDTDAEVLTWETDKSEKNTFDASATIEKKPAVVTDNTNTVVISATTSANNFNMNLLWILLAILTVVLTTVVVVENKRKA